jgi:hypothetical protein
MDRSRALRLAAALALAAGAGVSAWTRLAPIEPFLETKLVEWFRTDETALFDLAVTVRGGETIGEIRVEPVSGPVHVAGTGWVRDVRSGITPKFRLELASPATSKARVRVLQEGRVERTYEVDVEAGR